jgi:HMG (high mobility group) box
MAKNDKGRYEREMKDYEPPKGSEGSGKAAGSKKKAKDPNAPKRASTSYLYFSNEMRPKLKERQPELTFGELGQKLGEMFRKLTPEEKEKYEKLARDDKARFSKETRVMQRTATPTVSTKNQTTMTRATMIAMVVIKAKRCKKSVRIVVRLFPPSCSPSIPIDEFQRSARKYRLVQSGRVSVTVTNCELRARAQKLGPVHCCLLPSLTESEQL